MFHLHKSQHFLTTISVACFIIGILLRTAYLDRLHSIDDDERVWILHGTSLLLDHQPKAWTAFWNHYPSYESFFFGGKKQTTVTPFLDHPPLFACAIGKWAIITNNYGPSEFNWKILRAPMIFISLLTIVITSLLATQLFNKQTGLLTFISFIFLPIHVFSSRMIVAENVLVFLLVSSLVLQLYYQQTKSKFSKQTIFVALGVISFISPLIKQSGIIIPLSIIIPAIAHRHHKLITLAINTAITSILTQIVYANHYDLKLFFELMYTHASRPQSFWHFFTLFAKPDLGYWSIPDPMLIIGYISSLAALFSYQFKPQMKIYWVTAWFLICFILILVAPVEVYGWYKYISFPLAAIGLGYIWSQLLKRKLEWAILIIPASLVLIENTTHFSPQLMSIRKLLIGIYFLPVLVLILFPRIIKKFLFKLWWLSMLFLALEFQALWAIVFLGTQ